MVSSKARMKNSTGSITWEDPFDIIRKVDAFILGARMYPGYEQYWQAVLDNPSGILPFTGRPATTGETEYAEFAGRTPHIVVSRASSIVFCRGRTHHPRRHRLLDPVGRRRDHLHAIRHRRHDCGCGAVTRFPLAPPPTFLVPLAFILLVMSLWQLLGGTAVRQPAVTSPGGQ
jgi:hypothetical protein